MPLITVFTPVFNRAYIISQLYQSLCRQTNHDFEWIIVDDGSTDNLESLINQFIAEGILSIRYYRQENGGKHRAINKGVKEANGKLFFIVDSDDYLTDDAIQWISYQYNDIALDNKFAGLSGLRIDPKGHKIGGENDFSLIDTDAISIRVRYHVTGDLAEIYKTDILKAFPFPDIPGEKFCSEGLIWNRIAMAGLKLRYCYKPIYICEYLADGLTASRIGCRRESPDYSMLLYSEALKNQRIPLKYKIKYGILFWRYSEKSKKTLVEKCNLISPLYWPLLILGIIIRNHSR